MKNFLIMTLSGIIIAVAALLVEYHFLNTESPPTQLQTYRDLGGIETDKIAKPNATIESPALPTPTLIAATPINIEIQYLYRHQHSKEFEPLTNHSVLNSGDFYKIVLTPTEKTYLYIFQKGSSGNIFRLFPMKRFKQVTVNNHNPIQANQAYYVPAKTKSFFLDDQTGQESIYIIVAREKDERLEEQYQQVLMAKQAKNQDPLQVQIAQNTLSRAITSRDIGGITDDLTDNEISWHEDNMAGQTYSTMLSRLKSCDGCVSTLTFSHR